MHTYLCAVNFIFLYYIVVHVQEVAEEKKPKAAEPKKKDEVSVVL